MIWLLCVTLVGVYCWGQHWKNIAWRITDVVNEILAEEDDEGSSEEVVETESGPSDRVHLDK